MKKYCCENFSIYHQLRRETGYNIRVVKFKNDKIGDVPIIIFKREKQYVIKSSKSKFRFYITNGYKVFEPLMGAIVINYCPFCGENLYKFYSKDEYANEIEGETFTLQGIV